MFKYDNSILNDFARCPKYYYFAHVLCRRRVGSATALDYGKAIHMACDCMFKGEPVEKAIEAFRSIVTADLDEKRTIKTGELIIKDYYQIYKNQPFDEIIGTEKMLFVHLTNDIEFWMRLDKIVRWAYGVSVLDHKTTSSYLSEYTEMVDREYQYMGYIYGVQQLYKDAYGCIVDMIHIPRPLKTKPIQTQFDRVVLVKSPEQLDEWTRWAIDKHEWILHCAETGFYPEECKSCFAYHNKCQYLGVCELPITSEAKDEYIKSSIDFEDYIWQPWEIREAQ